MRTLAQIKAEADLITPDQLVAIREIADSRGVSGRMEIELECLETLKCRPEQLSQRAAVAFINSLTGE